MFSAFFRLSLYYIFARSARTLLSLLFFLWFITLSIALLLRPSVCVCMCVSVWVDPFPYRAQRKCRNANAGSLPIWSSIWQSYVVLLLIFHKSIPFEVRLLDLCVLLFALPTVACGMCVLIESLNQFWRGVAREIVCGNRVAHYFLDGAKESRAWG